MRTLLRFLGRLLAAGLLILVAVAVWLAVPGTPSSGASVRFTGYLPLPRTGILNVLDYLSVDGGQLYAASISSGAIWKIPLAGGPLATLPGKPAAHGVVLDPVSHMAFASRSGVNTVEVFDPATMASLATLSVAKGADGIFYDPKNRLVYVGNGDAMLGTLIDPATRTVVGTIPLGGQPEFAAFDPQTGWMLQNLENTDELLALDLATRTVVHRWPLEGCKAPSGMAIDPAMRRVFIACSGNARLATFDLDAGKLIDMQTMASHVDAIAYDAGLHRIYAAGAFGTMSVLAVSGGHAGAQSGAAGRLLDNIHTHFGAHTLAVDPLSHRVYVGYGGLFTAPRLAIFDAVP